MDKLSELKELNFALEKKEEELQKIILNTFTYNPEIPCLVQEVKELKERIKALKEEK